MQSCLLISVAFICILKLVNPHKLGEFQYKSNIAVDVDKWKVGTLISIEPIKDAVSHLSSTSTIVEEELADLRSNLDSEIGIENVDFTLYHIKNMYLFQAESCYKKLEVEVSEVNLSWQQIGETLPAETLEREERSLSQAFWPSLLDFGTGVLSTWRQYTNDRELQRINSRITSVTTGLEGTIIKVSNDLSHFQDEQTSINLSMNRQSWKLHNQMKSLKQNLTERFNVENRFVYFHQVCENALFSAQQMKNHLQTLGRGILLAEKNMPSDIVMNIHGIHEIVFEFQQRTKQETFFSIQESYNLIQFANFEVGRFDQNLLILADFAIPVKHKTHELYSFVPIVELIQKEDNYCKLATIDDIIITENDSAGLISPEEEADCMRSKKLIVCEKQIPLVSLRADSCVSSLLVENSTHEEVAKYCKLECQNSDDPVVVPLGNGKYQITSKDRIKYNIVCANGDYDEEQFTVGSTYVQVKQGCTLRLGSYTLSGQALNYQNHTYQKASINQHIENPKMTYDFKLKDVLQAKMKYLEEEIETEETDWLEFESIEENVKNMKIHEKIDKSAISNSLLNDYETDSNLKTGLVIAVLIMVVMLVILGIYLALKKTKENNIVSKNDVPCIA